MKNIKIALSALIISLFTSCQDAIDIVQPGEVPPSEIFKTAEDLEKGVLGAYQQMSTIGEVGFQSVFTDEVRLGFANGGQGLNDGSYGFVLNSNSGDAESIWGANYRLINYANRIIEAGEEIDDSNNAVAQARAMRAFGHFRLISYFSENPADDNADGVIKLDHVPTLNEHLPRVKNGEIFALINEDLDFAENNLATSGNTLITADFCTALRARMALYREKYTEAANYADALLASYSLSPAADYKKIWKDDKTIEIDEVIFKLDRIKGEARMGSNWASVNATITGSPFYSVSTDLFLLLNNGLDVRNGAFISGDSETANYLTKPGRIVIAKYPGTDDAGTLLNDEKIFRASEMVFILAEAAASQQDYAGVAANLQLINDARFIGSKPQIIVPANPTPEWAWAEILKQRRIEFAFEGHRYLDMKRLAKKAKVNLQRNPIDCAVNGACFLSFSDYRWTLPIPRAEFAANPNIGKQNTGY